MAERGVLRRARTAASLPGRVVACEDRTSALEREVAAQITGMRHELGEIRALLTALLESDGDTSELIGRLLRATTERLQALEESFEHSSELRARTEHAG